MKSAILLNLALLLIVTTSASAETRSVPTDYTTIQEAIDASSDGDVVIVEPGSYSGSINFNGRNITLTSVNPDAVKQASNVIAAAKRAGNPHVVRLAALVPEPAGETILGRMHKATEDEVKASGLPYTILKPTFFMQNTMNTQLLLN